MNPFLRAAFLFDGRYRASFFGRNLSDEALIVSGVHLAGPVVYYGQPRQLGVEVQVNF